MTRLLRCFRFAVVPALLLIKVTSGVCGVVSAPNYDQDLFPIDVSYASSERGDCAPVACAMVHGHYDTNQFPRLIPFGTNIVFVRGLDDIVQPYTGNAVGINDVVRRYKVDLGYQPGTSNLKIVIRQVNSLQQMQPAASTIWVAELGGVLHFSVFDAKGTLAISRSELDLTITRAARIKALVRDYLLTSNLSNQLLLEAEIKSDLIVLLGITATSQGTFTMGAVHSMPSIVSALDADAQFHISELAPVLNPAWDTLVAFDWPAVVAIRPRKDASQNCIAMPIYWKTALGLVTNRGGLSGNHAVCGLGWEDSGPQKWIAVNMGWNYAETAYFNFDATYVDEWEYCVGRAQRKSTGVPPGQEDDDPLEDGDILAQAKNISRGTVYANLRCLDTSIEESIVNDIDTKSYGDWYRVTNASPGEPLAVRIWFDNTKGNLDLRVYNDTADYALAGKSETEGDYETVELKSATNRSYYIYVFGRNNETNEDYSLVVPALLHVSPANAPLRRFYGDGPAQWTVDYRQTDFLPGDNVKNLQILPKIPDPGLCAPVACYAVEPTGGWDPRYLFVPEPGVLEVLPRKLVIRAADRTHIEGNPIPELPANFDGLAEKCDLEAQFGVTCKTDADQNSPPGTYDITVQIARPDPNYAIEPTQKGTLTILPKRENLVWLTDTGSGSPRVAVDAHGLVHIVYSSGGAVLYTRCDANGRFQTAATTIFNGGSHPDIAVDDDGNAHIVALGSTATSLLYAKLDTGGLVVLKSILGNTETVVSDEFFTWGASYSLYVREAKLLSPRIVLSGLIGQTKPIIGVVESSYQRTSYDWSPPPNMGFSMGEILNYIIQLGVQATLAIPRISPGGESIRWYQVAEDGNQAAKGTVFHRWDSVGWPHTIQGLSLAADAAGSMFFSWRTIAEGHTKVVWKTSADDFTMPPRVLDDLPGEEARLGLPEMAANEDGVAVAWAGPGGITVGELAGDRVLRRVTNSLKNVRSDGRLDITAMGALWRVAYVDSQSSQLLEIISGWDANGKAVESAPRTLASVSSSARRGTACGLYDPALASNGSFWALVCRAKRTSPEYQFDVAIYTPQAYGAAYSLIPLSRLWDRSDYSSAGSETSIRVHCDRTLLSCDENTCHPVEGVVADGVTPLLFWAGGLPTGKLQFKIVSSSLAAGFLGDYLETKLAVAGDFDAQGKGKWVSNLVHDFTPATREEHLCLKIDGVSLDELLEQGVQWSLAGKERFLSFNLKIYRYTDGQSRDQDLLLSVPFIIRKPPVVLVHGYNANSDSWAEDFVKQLEDGAGSDNGVLRINYGTSFSPDGPTGKPGYYLNTVSDLITLSSLLSTQLAGFENNFRRRWAMTKYDVVGHSQGGVLLRMLCQTNSDKNGFINERDFGRGRFRRVVTVGSPHNGSTLAYYLMTLKTELTRNADVWGGAKGSSPVELLYAILDGCAPNLLQAKFNPFSLEYGHIGYVNDRIYPHPSAKFHLISSVIDHTQWKPSFLLSRFGLRHEDGTLNIVLPAGAQGSEWGPLIPRSDGVVNFQSHFGGVVNPNLISGIPVPVAHAEPALYAAGHSQCESSEIAILTAKLLYGGASGEHFGPFVNPAVPGLNGAVQQAIDRLAGEYAARMVGSAPQQSQVSVSPVVPSAGFLYRFHLTAHSTDGTFPGTDDLAYPPYWSVRVYSPDERTETYVLWEPSATDVDGIDLRIRTGFVGQVVVACWSMTTSGTSLVTKPVVVCDTLTDHLSDLVISGVPASMDRFQQVQCRVFARLDNGEVSEFYQDTPRCLEWASADTNLFSVDRDGVVATHSQFGAAQLMVHYDRWVGSKAVRVGNQMPDVKVDHPTPGTSVSSGTPVDFLVSASDADGSIQRVTLLIDDIPVCDWTTLPYHWKWSARAPGTYTARAVAYDDTGGFRASLPLSITVIPQPPSCTWVTPQPDAWYAGALRLEAGVSDADQEDTASVNFEFSLNSSDGQDGEWLACGAAVTEPPYVCLWNTEPRGGLNDQVWVRARAVDAYNLVSPYVSRRIWVDNSFSGVTFTPHPGEMGVSLTQRVAVEFSERPSKIGGATTSDLELADAVALVDAKGRAVACAIEVTNDGRMVVLQPYATLEPRRQYTIQLAGTLRVAGKDLPASASSFQTTFGSPTGLKLCASPTYPEAGLTWQPAVEIKIVDSLGNRIENASEAVTIRLTSEAGLMLGALESISDAGVARFESVRVEKAGRIKLVMECASLMLSNSTDVAVLPGPLGSFVLEVPKQAVAGSPISIFASAYDVYGNLKTDYVGIPRLASGDPEAELTALPAFLEHHKGSRVYSEVVKLRSLGTQWLELSTPRIASPKVPIEIRNAPPRTPEPLGPTNLDVVGGSPLLRGTAFTDEDDAAHGSSQWQVASNALFSSVTWDSSQSAPETEITVPAGVLQSGHTYFWRVRYLDAPSTTDSPVWSAWSEPASFRTAEGFPFVDDFSEDLGWHASVSGLWQRAAAVGTLTGTPADDTSASNDRQVLATSFAGTPAMDSVTRYRIVSPAIDCSGQRLVELSFKRWLQIDSSDWAQAEIAVSVNGKDWVSIWKNGPDGVRDEEWKEVRYDITSLAAGQSTVYVSFGFGPQRMALPLSGWHIDDLRVEAGAEKKVVAKLELSPTNCHVGQVFEARILVKEQLLEANGVLGGAFDVLYDPTGLQLVSPPSSGSVVVPPYNEVKTDGEFKTGTITGLGGATLTEGKGNGDFVPFATLQFRARNDGRFSVSIQPGQAGFVLPMPVGLVQPERVHCEPAVDIQVSPAPVLADLEFRLAGPTNFIEAGTFFEILVDAKENSALASGFLGGAVDLFFDSNLVEPVTPLVLTSIVSVAYQSLGIVSGSIAENRIDELGGVTLTKGLADGVFVQYLRVPFKAKRSGILQFELGYSEAGLVLASPVGKLPESAINLGSPLAVFIQSGNTAPTLLPVPDQYIEETNALALTLVAKDNDQPPNRLSFALLNGPEGLTIDSAGALRWTPTTAQVPSTNIVVVKITDDGLPNLSHTNSFKVTVLRTGKPAVSKLNAPRICNGMLELSWTGLECVLQRCYNLSSGQWVDMPESIGVNTLTLPITGPAGYFRLRDINVATFRLNGPKLLGDHLQLTWTSPGNCILQRCTNLLANQWVDMPESIGVNMLNVPITGPAAYFRLRDMNVATLRLDPPRSVGGHIELTWTCSGNCILQTADSITNPSWRDIPESSDVRSVKLPVANGKAYFRLRTSP